MSTTLALVGNPNVGKTAVFNALTGLSQTTGNYAGVTVSRTQGIVHLGEIKVKLIDLPGTYSLAARSPDEIIVVDVLLDQRADEAPITGIIVVIDASNLERNLYFLSQLIELGKPFIVALNMMDIAERRGIEINHEALSKALGAPVVPVRAHKQQGFSALRKAILALHRGDLKPSKNLGCDFPESQKQALSRLAETLDAHKDVLGRTVPLPEVNRILIDAGGYAEKRVVRRLGADLKKTLLECREAALENGISLPSQEAKVRYAWVKEILATSVTRPDPRKHSRSEAIDNVLTHKFFGTIIFVGIMMFVFQSIYSWAGPVMDLVDGLVSRFGVWVGTILPEGMLQSMVVDGIVAGVGSVVTFIPQILLLSLFIALLEDCGYMARAAFLMDKLLGWCGLSGQSFLPMLSSFACGIPGVMATRTIYDRRDRFTTILVAPLMSCSARLPVYIIMIGAFIPQTQVLGTPFTLPALVLLLMYTLGIVVAIPVAWLLKKTIFRGEKPPLILEMPSYKVPQAGTVLKKVYREGKDFLERAGTLIFSVTIVVWALAYFPHSARIDESYTTQRAEARASGLNPVALERRLATLDDQEAGEYLRHSFLGRAGQWVEPVFRPMGWDWRIATATIASFPAREIIVATLGTLFNMGADEDAESEGLIATLRGATWPDGRPLFNIPVALSIMVFFALCAQCAAMLITVKRETGQWRWPVLAFGYMTFLAYVGAIITYQVTALIIPPGA